MLKISEIRKERGITQKDLAEYLNISPGNLCEWEKGRIEPSIDFLNKIADYFNVSIDYLVGREDDFGIKKEAPNIRNQRQLSKSDIELLSLMDKLSPFARDAILIQVRALAAESEKDSVK